MNDQKLDFGWHIALQDTYRSVIRLLTENIPLVIGAIAILVLGIAAAYLSRFAARKLTLAAERLLLRHTRGQEFTRPPAGTYSLLIGSIVFWSVLLFFLAASANLLEWEVFSDFLGALLAYLPNLFAAMLIALAGFILAGIVRTLVETAAATAGVVRPGLPARVAQGAIVLTALIIGIEQLGIDITFLTTGFIVIIGVLLFGASMAFALGARHFVDNLIAARLSRQHFQIGQRVKLPQAEGLLVEITQTGLVLDTAGGKCLVPARLLNSNVCEISGDGEESSASILGNLFRKKGDPGESA